ncbi:MAG TPA: hypothetical protein VLG25_00335, partial [Patescibacteria group bacterium]|nr:hypothetical protein [Patescibacteria group bacterium]
MSSVGKNAKKIQNLLASQIFFRLIIALSVLQGTWYALSFRPYIFDEGVHIGFIEVYTERLNPFISTQHPSLDFLGEITRNTSYLYYYLMSWPLRLINFLTGSEFSRIVFLRLLHVALFAGGLV